MRRKSRSLSPRLQTVSGTGDRDGNGDNHEFVLSRDSWPVGVRGMLSRGGRVFSSTRASHHPRTPEPRSQATVDLAGDYELGRQRTALHV